MTRNYGWRPDLADMRDRLTPPSTAPVPKSVDLRTKSYMPPIQDQGNLGSCTAHAIAGAYRAEYQREKGTIIDPSRLFIYYGERTIEHTITSDAGAMIRDGMKVVAKVGAPPESLWPYDITKFAEKPPQAAYDAAPLHKCLVYTRLSGSVLSVQQALAKGQLVVCGFTVYESFESQAAADTGKVPDPKKGERVLGGHAVCIVGYKALKSGLTLIWRNSWGPDWGAKGFFTTSDKFLKLTGASDFWTCSVIL